ncbi:MAG: hypothetical protein ACK4YP_18015, partial [Myxococcota bacterium]
MGESGCTWRREGAYCTIEIERPGEGILVVRFSGTDIGELGGLPFAELGRKLSDEHPVELFIDARATRGVSLDVSEEWALWLRANRPRLTRVTMLPGSRLVHVTADFVQRFSGLYDRMRVTTDAAAFDRALAEA